jgi:hypothetical protein
MSKTLNNATTTDAYQTFACQGTRKVNVQVSVAGVLIGFGKGVPGNYLSDDEPYAGAVGSLLRDCDEIRFRSAIRGTPGQLTLTTLP